MQREESLSQEKSPLHEATWARVSRLGEERAADMQTQNSQPSLPAGSRGERTRVPAPGCHHVVSELYRTHLSVWERQKPQRRLTGTPSSASAPLPDGRDGLSGYDPGSCVLSPEGCAPASQPGPAGSLGGQGGCASSVRGAPSAAAGSRERGGRWASLRPACVSSPSPSPTSPKGSSSCSRA